MRAIILAAGRGMRLQQDAGARLVVDNTFATPYLCRPLDLVFDGTTLLARHLLMLAAAGIDDVVLALGWQPASVEAELARLGRRVGIVHNPGYELGSVLTVHTVAEALTRGGDVLLMDADVLYDQRMISGLPSTRSAFSASGPLASPMNEKRAEGPGRLLSNQKLLRLAP